MKFKASKNVSRETLKYTLIAVLCVALAFACFLTAAILGKRTYDLYIGECYIGTSGNAEIAKTAFNRGVSQLERQTDGTLRPAFEPTIRLTFGKTTHDYNSLCKRAYSVIAEQTVDACEVYLDGRRVAVCLTEESVQAVIGEIEEICEKIRKLELGERVVAGRITSKPTLVPTKARIKDISGRQALRDAFGYYELCDTYDSLMLKCDASELFFTESEEFTPSLKLSAKPQDNESVLSDAVLTYTDTEIETISVEIPYITEYIYSDELATGTQKTRRHGRCGEKLVTYSVKLNNGKIVSRETFSEKLIASPQSRVVCVGTLEAVDNASHGRFIKPCKGVLTSGFGERELFGATAKHKGCDIAAGEGTPVISSDEGEVIYAGENQNGYGIHVIISHADGYSTLYAHMKSCSVKVGEYVLQGTQIGEVGLTGQTTGYHLHFEIRKQGTPVNPLDYISVK